MNTNTMTAKANTTTNANTRMSMSTLKKIASFDSRKVAEFVRHISRFHGLVAQKESARINGECYSGPNLSRTASVIYWVDVDELQRKVQMAESVAVSNIQHLNALAAENGLGVLLETDGMTKTQIAACVLHFVERLVRQSEYKDFMQSLAL
jgi:hypothetical protein